jgi:Tol biopolymer transport system component
MTVDDVDHLLDVSGPQLSPDGQWIAYTVRRVYTKADKNVTDLWMANWDGTQDIRLTYEVEHSISDPRWSPDGKYLSFLSDRPGAPDVKDSQVWVLDRRGGEAHCRGPRGASQRKREVRERKRETQADCHRPLPFQTGH